MNQTFDIPHDREFLQRMWPHVRGAFDYMERLRASERTEENRRRDPAFYGMMPASISLSQISQSSA